MPPWMQFENCFQKLFVHLSAYFLLPRTAPSPEVWATGCLASSSVGLVLVGKEGVGDLLSIAEPCL